MQAMIDPSQNVHEQMQQKTTEVDQGQQLNETPDTSNSSGQGYTEMGKVYKDPATGKLIMVEGWASTQNFFSIFEYYFF